MKIETDLRFRISGELDGHPEGSGMIENVRSG